VPGLGGGGWAVRRSLCAGALSALALATGAAPAHAIGTAPCSDPQVFEGAAVNAVILPYRFEPSPSADFGELKVVGDRITAMVQLEVLFAMLKYGSVGTTRLFNEDPFHPCDPNAVVQRVIERVRPGNGLAVIWGRIYVQGDQVYLQSYVRFARGGAEKEEIAVDLGPEGRGLRLVGRLPAQAVPMAPRTITRRDLDQIQEAFRRSIAVRPSRDEGAAGTPLEIRPRDPFDATIVDVQGDWMKLESGTGPSGWVRARTDSTDWALRRFMPELGYFDAVLGYLRVNARTPLAGVAPGTVSGWITSQFAAYEEAVGGDAAPVAVSLSRALRGFLLWTKPAPSREEAAQLCADSGRLAPHYAEARALAAITGPWLHASRDPADPDTQRRIDDGLLAALAVDPYNATVLDNLERLYTFAQAHPSPRPIHPDLAGRLAVVRAARAAARQ